VTDQVEGPSLEATGERLVPQLQHGEVVHAEHLARYLVAVQLAESRRVLDAACGEGYGTGLLAEAGATSALGVDLDERTVAHARARYPAAEFVQADVRRLPFEDGAFELVVSFETIEHVSEPESVLDELRRVLADDGLLLISTPNKHRYLVDNEFHEREFEHEEFVDLLSARFPNVEALLQHNWLASAVLPAAHARDSSGREVAGTRFGKLAGTEPGGELYTVALCGGGEIPALRPVVVAAGLDESHELATRLVGAERSAERWRGEYRSAQEMAASVRRHYEDSERVLMAVYDSVWWRMTAPLRWLADRVRRSDG
jgi:SAM-dependent methyltransferase